jgi:hypothetical protein
MLEKMLENEVRIFEGGIPEEWTQKLRIFYSKRYNDQDKQKVVIKKCVN